MGVIVLANRAPFKHELSLWFSQGHRHAIGQRPGDGARAAARGVFRNMGGTRRRVCGHECGSMTSAESTCRPPIHIPCSITCQCPTYDSPWLLLRIRERWTLATVPHGGRDIRSFVRSDFWNESSKKTPGLRAAVVAAEADGGLPLVLVQDYHFALAPRILRQLAAAKAGWWRSGTSRGRACARSRTCPWAVDPCSKVCLAATSWDFRLDDGLPVIFSAVLSCPCPARRLICRKKYRRVSRPRGSAGTCIPGRH